MRRVEHSKVMMKKREIVAQLFQQRRHLFQCPVCGGAVWMREGSLVCDKKHTFDLSKRGYLNLLRRPVRTRYDAAMFTSRRALCQSGFFDPLLAAISRIIQQERIGSGQTTQTVLDAGCGEGSHLTNIVEHLQTTAPHTVQGIGIDIAKDGVRLAARDAWHILWCVADLSQLPIAPRQIDALINILSPGNYDQFGRILKESGIVIKVAPGEQHLAELRARLFDKKKRAAHPHERVIQHFAKYFRRIDTQHLAYTKTMTHEHLESLIAMTPLSWNVMPEKRQRILRLEHLEVMVDAHILIGKKADMVKLQASDEVIPQ
jgi:23S rRNA (guanine745-N1)-methyltransferase